jgi:cystathionine gamma-synthase
MKTGYPRFFVSRVVARLAMRLLTIYQARTALAGGNANPEIEDNGQRLAMLLDSIRHAQLGRKALSELNPAQAETRPRIRVYLVTWGGGMTLVDEDDTPDQDGRPAPVGEEDIVLVSYPEELAAEAKAFWQHTGFGISSRRATHWLEHAPFLNPTAPSPIPPPVNISLLVKNSRATLKQRIATGYSDPSSNLHVSPSDVFLFPTGMTAITETAEAIKGLRHATPSSPHRVAVFGSVPLTPFLCPPHNC